MKSILSTTPFKSHCINLKQLLNGVVIKPNPEYLQQGFKKEVSNYLKLLNSSQNGCKVA